MTPRCLSSLVFRNKCGSRIILDKHVLDADLSPPQPSTLIVRPLCVPVCHDTHNQCSDLPEKYKSILKEDCYSRPWIRFSCKKNNTDKYRILS